MKKFQLSEKISLKFVKKAIFPQVHPQPNTFRLKGFAAISQKSGKPYYDEGIIDTGALATVIPKSIWKDLLIIEEYGETEIAGI